jgi:hypothetical protein
VSVAIGAGVLAAAAAALVGIGFRSGVLHAVFGAVFTGAIVALAVADVTVDGAGSYWEGHPMLGAGLSGLLLVGLTVLVVNRLIERGEARRWRRVARRPVGALVRLMDEPAIETGWVILTVAAPTGWPEHATEENVAILRALAKCAESMAAEADRQGPILTANAELLGLFGATSNLAVAGRDLSQSVARYADVLHRNLSAYDEQKWQADHGPWRWEAAANDYDDFMAALARLERAMEETVGLSLSGHDAPWRQPRIRARQRSQLPARRPGTSTRG